MRLSVPRESIALMKTVVKHSYPEDISIWVETLKSFQTVSENFQEVRMSVGAGTGLDVAIGDIGFSDGYGVW